MKKKIPYIAIVGGGLIGQRHLESINKFNKKLFIFIVDKNQSILEKLKKKAKKLNLKHKYFFFNNVNKLPKKIDLAIISTTAEVRKNITIKLLNRSGVRFIIFEKFVFQNIDDFKKIIRLLKLKKVKSWVNCPRRMFEVYKRLKKKINKKSIKMNVEGSNWGLASNSIHMLDLFSFFTNQKKFNLLSSSLDEKIYKTKREKFIELSGTIKFKSLKNSTISLADKIYGKKYLKITIYTKNRKFLIYEKEKVINYFELKKNSLKKHQKFEVIYQSNLTHKQVKQILKNGKSELNTLEDSQIMHCLLINIFNKHLSKLKNKKVLNCPIT